MKKAARKFTDNEIVNNIIPNASARGKLPFDVSKDIEVVITLVKWSILPPTIITAPTSDIARPKPAKTTVTSEYLASYRYALIAF